MAEAVAHNEPSDVHVSTTTSWVNAAPPGLSAGSGGDWFSVQGFFCGFVFR